MKDSRYPKNWKAIALTKKQSVNWTCEKCGRKCLESGAKTKLSLSERKRFELSVHHSDYDPENNSPENLIALCSGCHLGKHSRKRGNVNPGRAIRLMPKTLTV
jgi:5-methylcytosine-specific restriction endonuclease McrA